MDGIWGGYRRIQNARLFLLSKLLSSRNALQNIYDIASNLDRHKPFVAAHMRFGADFATLRDGESARGKWNIQIPGEWYLGVREAFQICVSAPSPHIALWRAFSRILYASGMSPNLRLMEAYIPFGA